MNFKNTILTKYMVRKNKKQKDDFIEYVKNELKETDYEINIEKGEFGVRNIVVGDIKNAKVVFTAHYDTCAVMPIPNFITPTNIGIYLLYQLLLVVPIILIAVGGALIASWLFPNFNFIGDIVYFLLIILILGLMMFGPANKNTVNDNTSGTITILEMINKVPDKLKNKVAFVLFDLEEAGLIGSSSFSSKHKKEMKNKLLINFDCVSDGDKLLFVFNKKAKDNLSILENVYTNTDNVITQMVTKGAFYPSDQVNFTGGVGVCSVIRGKKFEYIDKIHTNKDTVCRDENIEYLIDKSIELVEKM